MRYPRIQSARLVNCVGIGAHLAPVRPDGLKNASTERACKMASSLLAKEIVEQKIGKYAGILRPIIADAERRCSLAEAQLLGTQQRLDKLQKAQK